MDSLFAAGVFNLIGMILLIISLTHLFLAKQKVRRVLYLKLMIRSGYCIIGAAMFFILNLIIHRDIPYIIFYVIGLANLFYAIHKKQKELKLLENKKTEETS